MKCENAHERGAKQCWNHVQVNMTCAQRKLVEWLIDQVNQVPLCRSLLAECAKDDLEVLQAKQQRRRSTTDSTIAQLESEQHNITRAIRAGGKLACLVQQLQEIEQQLTNLRALERETVEAGSEIPDFTTTDEIDEQLPDVLLYLAANSPAFAALLRQIITRFEIFPVQAIDSGLVRPRAKVTLSLERLRQPGEAGPAVPDVQAELNFFEPPKAFRHRQLCADLKRKHPEWSYVTIASAVNQHLREQAPTDRVPETISNMTVKRCLSVTRKMEAEGLSEPYRVLVKKPARASRWKQRSAS